MKNCQRRKEIKKIMFNDTYGLTKAVLEGRKTMTRRIIKAPRTMDGKDVYGFSVVRYSQTKEVVEVMALDADGAQINNILPKYKVGEVVAVAQSYSELSWDARFYERLCSMCERLPQYELAGWDNKMFVRADLMPHRIRITDIKVERLRNISTEECLQEGVESRITGCHTFYFIYGEDWPYNSLRRAFASLINKVSGKGTWESNPWVFVYEFELVQ